MKKFNANQTIIIGLTIVLGVIISFILFFPPQVGIANSGDFGRIIDLFGLYYIPGYSNFNHFYDVFTTNRPFNAPHYGGYMATTSIFLFIAYIINYLITLLSDNGYFYIYCLSALYVIAYLFGFYFLLKVIYNRLGNTVYAFILGIIGVIFFSDTLFIEYFNSFFQEPAFIVCFLLFISCFLYFKSFLLDIFLLALVIFSKEQNLIYLILLIPLFIKYKPNFLKFIACIIVFTPVLLVYQNINTYAKSMNTCAAIFGGLLEGSSFITATEVLQKLNLNPDYAVFAGKTYWQNVGLLNQNPQNIELFEAMLKDIKTSQLIVGYINYPNKIVTNYTHFVNIIEKEGPFAPNLGNYKIDQQGNYRVKSFNYFSLYVLHYIKAFMLANVLISILISVMAAKKPLLISNPELLLIIILNVICLLSPLLFFLGDGFSEEVKHSLELYFTQTVLIFLQLSYMIKLFMV